MTIYHVYLYKSFPSLFRGVTKFGLLVGLVLGFVLWPISLSYLIYGRYKGK